MSHYRSDRTHAQFLLFDVFGVDRAYGVEPYEDFDPETAAEILEQVEAFAHDKLADSFPSADVHPIRLDPVRHTVTLPRDLRASLAAHVASDWLRLDLPADVSGIHVPASLRWAATEFILGANPAVAMCSQLIPTVVAMLHRNGNKEQQRLAELILERNWTVTMVLTEPDAGSDVGSGAPARPSPTTGTWHLTGTKRFITWAAHDAAENVIHCVLARPQGVEGQGGPGTKGLSLFIGPVAVVRPADRGTARPQRGRRRQHRAQDGHPRHPDLRAGARRSRAGRGDPPRRHPRRHPADVRDHHLRPDDGRPQDGLRPVQRAPQRPRLRDEPQAGARADLAHRRARREDRWSRSSTTPTSAGRCSPRRPMPRVAGPSCSTPRR
jgi:hypothetical protein